MRISAEKRSARTIIGLMAGTFSIFGSFVAMVQSVRDRPSRASFLPISPFDYATIDYDTSNRRGLWLDRHNGSGNQSDVPSDLALSPDGSKVCVTGSSDGINSGTDYLTLAYAASVP